MPFWELSSRELAETGIELGIALLVVVLVSLTVWRYYGSKIIFNFGKKAFFSGVQTALTNPKSEEGEVFRLLMARAKFELGREVQKQVLLIMSGEDSLSNELIFRTKQVLKKHLRTMFEDTESEEFKTAYNLLGFGFQVIDRQLEDMFKYHEEEDEDGVKKKFYPSIPPGLNAFIKLAGANMEKRFGGAIGNMIKQTGLNTSGGLGGMPDISGLLSGKLDMNQILPMIMKLGETGQAQQVAPGAGQIISPP